jgi:hypothetical protein
MVAGDFVGEVRFHPGSTAARLEQAIVESTSPEFVDASDPVLTGYDAVGAPRGFVRGTTTGTLSRTRTNYLLGRAVLADGDWVVSGYADSSSFKFAGETVGADGYVARVSATGQLKWLRRHAGFVGYSELVSTASGNLYARSFVEGDGTLFVDSPTPYVVTAPPEHEHGDVSVVSRLTPEGAIAWNRMYRCTTGCYQSLTPLADGGVLIKLGGGGHAGTYDLTDPAGGVLASGAIDPNRSVLIQLAPDGTLARATEFDVNIASIVELDDGRLVGVINAWTDFLPAALASVPVPPGLGEDGRLAALLVLAPDHTQQQLAVIGTNLTPELAAIPGGVVVASDVYMQTDIHLVDATGNFSHQPACAVDECLHVLAYVTDETVGVH